MTSIFKPAVAVATQANRAIGAMFFSVFGGAWLALGTSRVFAAPIPAFVLIACATLILLWVVLRIYKVHAPALAAEPETDQQRRQSRIFHFINGGQWLVILVVGNVLANMGLGAWVIPAAIFVIGAHFLPLAKLFGYSPHYMTGAAMMLLAAGYPVVAPAGASSPVGCFGAGIILWLSAVWAITRPAPQ